MKNDTSLKEYYINLQNMYSNAVSMLNALNQSLTTSSSEIEVTIADSDDVKQTIRIPSFLYLENKLEELNSNMSLLFNIPEDGEAWFTKADTTYKLNLVKSNTAPIAPSIDTTTDIVASITDNNFLKDLVFPKTFLKLKLNQLPDNIEKIFMRKVIINSYDTFSSIQSYAGNNKISYDDLNSLIYNLKKGIDYEMYDNTIDLPIKKELYSSAFRIEEIIKDIWKDGGTKRINYIVRLNTLLYQNEEDSSINYTIKVGDLLSLGNEMIVYKVINIFDNQTVQLEEYIGHTRLSRYSDNNSMVLQIYVADYSRYKYVDVPLEENKYIIVFIGSMLNNVRSLLSEGYICDLSSIKMVDSNGNAIKDNNDNQYYYINYYNEYCSNLGDLLMGMSKCSYSQITNYTPVELENLLLSLDVKNCVNQSVDVNSNLKVVPINAHLIDDATNQDIINLHTQKNEINAKLQTCQSNIDQVYSTMLTTDFSQNVTVTQQSLQTKIQGLYTERISLQKQLNAIVDNINTKVSTSNINSSKTKYRIRGLSDVNVLESYLSKYNNAQIIGIDIEYKYVSTNKATNTLTNINSTVFTDWVKQVSYDKERKLVFKNDGYGIEFDNQSQITNTIKWNQFDIPINEGEDVVIRFRYKYSIGQPFITLYTPWSDEQTVVFPSEYTENIEVTSIIDTNNKDTVSAAFNKTLINEGYTEHISNKVLSNEQTFFHMPENIYSGFNTPENNLISLKDKLTEMSNTLDKYTTYLNELENTSYEIYLNYDDNSVPLINNSINKINIYNTEHITDLFIRKEMNIVIKNTGSTILKLYSIFPGNVNTHLINYYSDNLSTNYMSNKINYERVPMFVANELDAQYLNQWIYFRQNNPYTLDDIYYNDIYQNSLDYSSALNYFNDNKKLPMFNSIVSNYQDKTNKQCLIPFRNNAYISGFNYSLITPGMTDNEINKLISKYQNEDENLKSTYNNFNFFKYSNYYGNSKYLKDLQKLIEDSNISGNSDTIENKYILRYEDYIIQKDNVLTYLDEKTSLSKNSEFINISNISDNTSNKFVGGYLFPNLLSRTQLLITDDKTNYKSIEIGASLSIPIVFEYYVTTDKPTVTKSIYFDIRNSIVNEPRHYMLEITGNFDYTASGEIYKNIDFIKED